jgi:hypothetical protein
MKPSTREQLEVAFPAPRQPETVELLVSENARRCTINQHLAFRESLTTRETIDEIDGFLEELRAENFERRAAL